jgi:hypothetical protein
VTEKPLNINVKYFNSSQLVLQTEMKPENSKYYFLDISLVFS